MYLTGGQADGRSRIEEGARDPSPPRADEACVIDRPLGFQGHSRNWGGGGVGFVDPEAAPSVRTLGRRYLISHDQFQDVMAQESGRPVGDAVDMAPVFERGDAHVGDGSYDRALLLGMVQGVPVVTFTTTKQTHELEHTAPGDAYAATIRRGLAECHGLSDQAAATYIASHTR